MEQNLALGLQWVELISKIAVLTGGLIAAFWAYTRFILERGLLPPSQFDIGCNAVGLHADKRILEILLRIKNLGSATLVVTNLRVDLRYLHSPQEGGDKAVLHSDPTDERFGSLHFPESFLRLDLKFKGEILVGKKVEILERPIASARGGRGIPVLRDNTFVQPAVSQLYTFVTAVPASAAYVLVYSSFRYELKPSLFQRLILAVGRRLGLIQYTLDHVRKPHTAQRVFNLRNPALEASSAVPGLSQA